MAIARTVFRDFEVEFTPSSGKHQPNKSEIRELLAGYEALLAGVQAGGGIVFSNIDYANANLQYPANQLAWVTSGTEAGVYAKSGAAYTGAWVKQLDLPYSFSRATNVGGGTANAIVAAYIGPHSNSALIVFNVTHTNTSSTVTVKLDDDSPRTIKTASNNAPPIGSIIPNMVLAGYIDGVYFRLISDLSTAAFQVAAEAAATAAAASAAAAAASAATAAGIVGSGVVDFGYGPVSVESVLVGETFVNARLQFNLLGSNDSGDRAKLQAGYDAMPVGAKLYYDNDDYLVLGTPLIQTVQFDHILGSRARISGVFTDPDHDTLRVSISDAAPLVETRCFTIDGGSFLNSGGRAAININPAEGALSQYPQFKTLITRGLHAGNSTCIRIGANGDTTGETAFGTISMCNLEAAGADGVIWFDRNTDGWSVDDNILVNPLGPGVLINLREGAFANSITHNAIRCRDAAIYVQNGGRISIIDNQMEHYTSSTNTHGAMIFIAGAGYIASGIIIKKNNFGGGVYVDSNIAVYRGRGVIIDENQMYPAVAQDILFGSDAGLTAKYNIVGPNNDPKGTRTERFGDETDATRRLIIFEHADCVGNRGIWKPLPSMSNSWATNNGEYFVDQNQVVHFEGGLTGGTLTTGTAIMTLPLGVRPNRTKYVPVGTGSGVGMLSVSTAGVVTTSGVANADVSLGSVSFPVKGADSYDIGPA